MLFNGRPQDPPQKVGYGDDHFVLLRGESEEPWLWLCSTSRHWNLDRADPR